MTTLASIHVEPTASRQQARELATAYRAREFESATLARRTHGEGKHAPSNGCRHKLAVAPLARNNARRRDANLYAIWSCGRRAASNRAPLSGTRSRSSSAARKPRPYPERCSYPIGWLASWQLLHRRAFQRTKALHHSCSANRDRTRGGFSHSRGDAPEGFAPSPSCDTTRPIGALWREGGGVRGASERESGAK